jgi:hypothetical protein
MRFIRTLGLATGPWLLALPAVAQPAIDVAPSSQPATETVARPETAGRIVKVFDFEEAKTNPGEVPRNWFRAQDSKSRPRPGFPDWNKADLSYIDEGGVAFRGNGSVRLPTKGGSTSVLLGEGVLPVFQNADYLLSAKVRTDKLTHARAALAARFLDKSGAPIPGSDVRTPLAVTGGLWQDISVELVGEFDNAAYIQLELQLLQPEQYTRPADANAHMIWEQDFAGAAWFDDVAVVQLPRIELATTAPANIVTTPDHPQLKVVVRDLTGESLVANVDILDLSGKVVDHMTSKIGAGFTHSSWTPKLSMLGWYRATMEIDTEAGARVGQSYTDFIWIPGTDTSEDAVAAERRIGGDRTRFGLVCQDLPAPMLTRLPELVRRIGGGTVTLPFWTTDLTPDQVVPRTETLRPLLDSLFALGQQVTLSFARVPTLLMQQVQVEPNDTWTVLAGDPTHWMPYAAPMLEHFGPRISHWQVGQAGDDLAFWRKDLPHDVTAMTDALGRLVPGPVITIPTLAGRQWPKSRRTPGGGAAPPALLQSVTPDTTATGVAQIAKDWAQAVAGGQDAGEMTLVFEPFPPEQYGVEAGAVETAKRAVEFWAACSGADGRLASGASMALDQSWAWTQARRPQLLPRPDLAVWRCLIDRLTDRRVVGTFPVADGVVCYVLAPSPSAPPGRGGAIVAWTDSAPDAFLTSDLGEGPVRIVDIFGNARPAPVAPMPPPREGVPPASRPVCRIPITATPIFIEGIDVALIRFMSSFSIEPPYLESSNDQHEREFVITNPWPTGITGRITILEPGGFETGQKDRSWRISPRMEPFAVAAGKTERLPIKIAFSPVEEVGPKQFVMAIELAADKPYGTIEVRRTIEVGVKTIGLELTSTTQGKSGQDLVVEAMVSNTGAQPLTVEITAFAEGLPRSKASITDLAPGNQAVKRFIYPGSAAKLQGQRVVISVFDPDTKMRVNKSIVIK